LTLLLLQAAVCIDIALALMEIAGKVLSAQIAEGIALLVLHIHQMMRV
jgi:hypothetical protein